ncbi:MAG: hypothetical protein HY245_07385 [Rhizobiales bacterium]|nr:hypothetical protein [Hyphomicrobiales bacterium]
MAEDHCGRLVVGVEGALGPLDQRFAERPVGCRVKEIHDPGIARFLGLIAEIDKLDQLGRRRVLGALGGGSRLDELAGQRQLGRLYRQAGSLRLGMGGTNRQCGQWNHRPAET